MSEILFYHAPSAPKCHMTIVIFIFYYVLIIFEFKCQGIGSCDSGLSNTSSIVIPIGNLFF